jgi:hypothetical protein
LTKIKDSAADHAYSGNIKGGCSDPLVVAAAGRQTPTTGETA